MRRYAAFAGASRAAAPKPLDGGDWPHTNRIMPWLLAGFLVMLFLVPFDHLTLPAASFFDFKFDRFLLVAILVTWVASVASKRSPGPRFVRNRLAGPVIVLVFVALASVAFNLETLVRLDLLGLSVKKLALLFSWVLLFFMVVTTVRPAEVRSYGKLIIGLATLTALATIYEYRTEVNLLWTWSDKLIPGFVISDKIKLVSVDSMGRRNITGPASHGLACVTLLSLAMPFALSEFLAAKERRWQVLYACSVGLLVAGCFATSRKTAAFVPIATVLVFLAYRPRQTLRLWPLLIVLVPVVHFLAPNAMGSIRKQLFPERGFTSQNTVSDRTADYNAVKPDIRSHLALGKGYGSYDHEVFRLLDNQWLGLMIEIGFVGIGAFLLLIVGVPWVAHRVIRFGGPARAPPALACAASAAGFGVANALFDALAFPHVPYTFIFVAGLTAVLASEPLPERALERARARRPLVPGPQPAGALTSLRQT